MLSQKRITLIVLVCVLVLTGSTCRKTPSNNNNTQPAAGQIPKGKVGRWIAQFRSSYSKNLVGINLATYSYSCLSVVSPSLVYAGGDMPDPKTSDERIGVFLRSTDGGQTWSETLLDRKDARVSTINAIQFVNEKTGWMAGATQTLQGKEMKRDGVVLRTNDGGANWEVVKLPIKQIPICIFFTDENNGWMGGAPIDEEGEDDNDDKDSLPSDLLATTDGGKTWQAARRLPVTIKTIYFPEKSVGWMVGQKGSIYKTNDGGKSWDTQKSELEPGEGAAVDITGEGSKKFNMQGVYFIDTQTGFATATSADGREGRVLGTVNGGATWSKKFIGQGEGFRDVYFLNASEGWVLSTNGRYIYHTVDGGRYWSGETISFDQDVPFFKIKGTDEKHIWAAAGGGIFYRLLD
jgi:photosystem II stability/assembly factor-like uncharacterized protein